MKKRILAILAVATACALAFVSALHDHPSVRRGFVTGGAFIPGGGVTSGGGGISAVYADNPLAGSGSAGSHLTLNLSVNNPLTGTGSNGSPVTFSPTVNNPITGTGSNGSPFGLSLTVNADLAGTGSNGSGLGLSAGTEAGQVKGYDGTGWSNRIAAVDPSLSFYQSDDFTNFLTNCTIVGNYNFIGTANGTGAGCQVTGAAGHPGIINLHTGTTAAGYARIRNNATNTTVGSNAGAMYSRWLVYIPQLSTAADEFIMRGGFLDTVNGSESTEAIEFIYDRLNIGTMLAMKTCTGGVCTTTKCDGNGGTTLVTITASQWHTYEVSLSSDGVTATIKYDGATCATATAHIPTQVAWGFQVAASAYTAVDKGVYVDYEVTRLPFSAAR